MSSRKTLRRREPSGRPSRAEEDVAVSPTAAKRLLAEAVRDVSRAEYGSQLGRLFMAAKISPAEYQAGRRWAVLVVDYHQAIGAPLPYPPPGPIAALGTVGGRNTDDDPPVTTAAGRRMLEARRRVGERMLKAEEELYRAGDEVLHVVRTVCERDEVLAGYADLLMLRDGLDRLARHWKLSR